MAVSGEMPRAPARTGPAGHAIVTEHDLPPVDLADEKIVDLGEVAKVLLRSVIVIPSYENLLSLKPRPVLVGILPREVSDDVHEVMLGADVVSVGDERLVHLENTVEGALAVPPDVVVTQVEVRCGEDLHVFPLRKTVSDGGSGSVANQWANAPLN